MMKRLMLMILALVSLGWAQTYHDAVLENPNTFTKLNTFSGGVIVGPFTVATLPLSPAPNTIAFVVDAQVGGTCLGGGTGVLAIYVGGSWNCAILGSGGSGGSSYGTNASIQAGADPCVKIQTAIYSLPATGGIVNATGFGTISACSVNPFQAPSQANPTVFTSIPSSGLLLLPNSAFPTDLPWFIPNKWTVQGVGGYGVNRTVVQPTATFKTNRVQSSATGGASGCSTTNGSSTITISGTTIPNSSSLVGMFLLCSSNVSATAVPTPKNAQVGAVITAVSGGGPYTLTVAGPGAAGTVANTGWVVSPVVMGWQPNSLVFGSLVNQVTASCTTPVSTNVTGCVAFLDLTGNEGAMLANFTALNYDYMGIGVFTSQAQNGGPFGPITLNSSTTGNNSTIGIEVGGTGWNASGGGGSGLCAVGNPCAGAAMRGFFGVTDTGSGTGAGDGGIGIDVNASNVRVRDSHCESLKTCVMVGDSAAVQGVKVDSITGCTNSGCALTSVVDISASYATGSAPAPTQNVTVENVQRAFSSTWDVRDFISLTGVTSDPGLAWYVLGASGAAGRMVFTSSQQMSCITTGGAVDSNGSHCAPASQFQIISKMGGHYFADAWNNNGTADVCVQFNNTMQWVAVTAGITNGAIIDATGLNRVSGYPCATNPFAGTLGTNIPASGVLQLGLAKFFLSVPWVVPANWTVQGTGGAGLGTGGASGSLLAPNVSNTSNANYGNDTVAGTVTTSIGAYAVTSSVASFNSGMVGHYLMACAALPCTNQASMVGGLISIFTDTTHVTLDVPAQATLVAAAYTVTAPLVQNAGILRDLSIDGNSYGTGGGNGNGGFVGLYENGGSASYVDNLSVAHVNAVGVDASGLNNGTMSRIAITGNGVASSVFQCVSMPQGINLRDFTCQSGTSPTPTLSYGVMASGSGFSIINSFFQNVKVGIELAVNPNFSTNNVTVMNAVSGSGSTAVTTLADLGTVTSGANGPAFQADLLGLQCPSGCSNIVIDSFTPQTLTDAVLGSYLLSRTDGSSNRTIFTDSITANVLNLQTAGNTKFGGGANGVLTVGAAGQFCFTANICLNSGSGIPSAGSCVAANGGSLYLRTNGTTTTTLYVCDNSTHVWTAK